MTERHESVQYMLNEADQIEDPVRKLRWKARILVQHYACHRKDSYDTFMAMSSLSWHLEGRPGLSPADRLLLVSGALADLAHLVSNDPEDPELSEALVYCQELHRLTTEALVKAQQQTTAASMEASFAKWLEQLPETPETSEKESDDS